MGGSLVEKQECRRDTVQYSERARNSHDMSWQSMLGRWQNVYCRSVTGVRLASGAIAFAGLWPMTDVKSGSDIFSSILVQIVGSHLQRFDGVLDNIGLRS